MLSDKLFANQQWSDAGKQLKRRRKTFCLLPDRNYLQTTERASKNRLLPTKEQQEDSHLVKMEASNGGYPRDV
jgi:hypothetical protein